MAKRILTEKEILHLSKLANLSLTDDEIKLYGEQLSEILSYISQLEEVDTTSVEGTTRLTQSQMITAEDKVSEEQSLKSLDNLKVEIVDGKKYFKVKRIL